MSTVDASGDAYEDNWADNLQEPDDEYAAPVFASVPVSAPPGDSERPEEEQEGSTRVLLRKASGIAMKGVRWLYRGRIPDGMVTLLAGREGIGKSTVALDIAAQLTRGTLDGRYLGRPQNVVICATEDSWSHTIRPRLQAVGCDLDRVFHIAVQDEDGHERAIVAPQDTRRMEAAFTQVKPALMIIDPLMAIIDGRVDTHKQAEVQQALEPMVKMCERVGMAILALIHVNKSGGTDPLNSIMGSKAFATLPRSILYCIEEDQGDFLFCHVKCNVGPKMPSIHYRIDGVQFDLPPEEVEEGDDPFITSNRVVWGEVDDRSATDVMVEAAAVTPAMGSAATQILDLVNASGVVTIEQIKTKLPDLTARQIENATTRMVRSGKIDRPERGTYTSVSTSRSA